MLFSHTWFLVRRAGEDCDRVIVQRDTFADFGNDVLLPEKQDCERPMCEGISDRLRIPAFSDCLDFHGHGFVPL